MRASRERTPVATTPRPSTLDSPMSRPNLPNTDSLRRPARGMAVSFQASRVRLAHPGPAPG